MVAGAGVGNSIEGSGSYVQNVQQCTTQTFHENRTVAYNVTYEYAGQEHSVQLPYDPGATIRLELTPMAGTTQPPAEAPPDYRAPGSAVGVIVGAPQAQPVMVAPPVAYTTYYPAAYPAYPAAYPAYPYPAYPAYYARPYFYPPVGVSLNFGYSSGHYHRR